MDPAVLRGMARWPDVPAVYGWLALDRRGNWRLKEAVSGRFGRIGHAGEDELQRATAMLKSCGAIDDTLTNDLKAAITEFKSGYRA